jgi:Zn-dependent protease
MVVLPLIGLVIMGFPFGFASTPYDPYWARRHPKRSALMSLAGPVSNLLLVVVAAIALRLFMASGYLVPPRSIRFGHIVLAAQSSQAWEFVAFLIGAFFSMNLFLCIFNLLPLPPMDGSGVVPLVLTERATASYQDFVYGNPMIGIVGMLVAWQLIDIVFFPVFFRSVELLYFG